MRVHPTVLRSANAKWHFPVAVLLLLGVIVSNLMRGSDSTADAASQAPLKQVVIVAKALSKGQELKKDMFVLQHRPMNTLPSDHISSWEEIEGMVPVGLVPAGYPLAKSLLADPKSLEKDKPAVTEQTKKPEDDKDPFAKKLKKISKNTVAVGVEFNNAAPPRGSRAAISLKGVKGHTVLVADDAWVETSNKKFAQLRVPTSTALFIEEAKAFGRFSYFLVSEEGSSPFEGQAVKNIDELKERLGLVQRAAVADPNRNPLKQRKSKKLRADSFSSYAWITGGSGVKYSVGKDGRLFVITQDGQVNPLYNHRMGLPPENEDEAQSEYQQQDVPAPSASESFYETPVEESSYSAPAPNNKADSRRVESGLEPLFPLMGLGR